MLESGNKIFTADVDDDVEIFFELFKEIFTLGDMIGISLISGGEKFFLVNFEFLPSCNTECSLCSLKDKTLCFSFAFSNLFEEIQIAMKSLQKDLALRLFMEGKINLRIV
jgi:hypothetical protein